MRITSALLGIFILAVCAPAGASIIYTNGPIGSNESIIITAGKYQVADTFASSGPAIVSGFDAGIWVSAGDTPTRVTWTICTGAPSWESGSVVATGEDT